jgi:hypothetical protein
MTQAAFWNVFHDGRIGRILTYQDGSARLFIDIPYLRAMFPGQGVGFWIILRGCTQISYTPFHGQPMTDIEAIVALDLDIFGLQASNPVQILAADGILTLTYRQAIITFDSGEPLALETLLEQSAHYWQASAATKH